jgi:adenine-specific DNA-methyltransferase
MSKEQKITNNIKVPNKDLEALRLHFPHCFDKDGNFQLEKFKNNLTEKEINFSAESYGLDWLGKSYARLLATDPATTLLKADETHNSKPENLTSENLLIKGDNLEVLKHLSNAYYEQVKMIYIDPPYNTGSDGFVYNDDRKFTAKELQNLIGVDAEKAKRILAFTQSKSNSHSAWLTFMYPRLYIAKQLLKDDGVIFISIDDNEVAQLRLLMDEEIFGEEHFLNLITIKAKPSSGASGGGEDKRLKKNVEYLLCFTKSREQFEKFNDVFDVTDLKEYIENYKAEGKSWKYTRILNSLGTKTHFTDTVDGSGESIKIFKHENVEIVTISDIAKRDRITEEEAYFKYFEKIFRDTNAQSSIRQRVIDCTDNDDTFYSIEYTPRSGRNKNQLTTLYYKGRNKDLIAWLSDVAEKKGNRLIKKDIVGTLWANFNWNNVSKEGDIQYPNGKKPISFIKRMIEMTSSENKDDIILDFFAGSGSTAHAVMDINTSDFGKRKSISIQIDEPISDKDKKEYYSDTNFKVIFDITKERLLRSAKKLNAELNSRIEKLKTELPTEETKIEIERLEKLISQNGFKIFETTPIWEDYDFEAEQFDSSQTLFDAGKLTEDDLKALLVTWRTNDNISLSQELETIDLGGYTAFYGNGKLYLLHKNFTTENLKAVLEKIDSDKMFNPTSIIAFGYHFESKSLRELSENVKQYANKKKIDIDFITRY